MVECALQNRGPVSTVWRRWRMRETPGRIRWLAILIGYLVDTVISTFITWVAALFDPRLMTEITFSSYAGAVTAVLLVVSTGVGGWLAGRLAKQEYVLHGALVGGLGIILMLILSVFDAPPPLIGIVL